MSRQEIPLVGGSVNSHQIITVQLGDNLLEMTLDYLQTGQWTLAISQEGTTLASGAMLEPNCDIIESFRLGIGKLVFVGDNTTLDNLGKNNSLVWVSE
jgi:hypothetical protein